MQLDPHHIREFLARPRKAVEELKAEWWASKANSDNGMTPIEAGHGLLAHAKTLDPSFPGDDYREADLQHHVHLKALISRASQTLTSR